MYIIIEIAFYASYIFAFINSRWLDPILCRNLANTFVDCFRDIEEKASSSPRSKLNQMLEMMKYVYRNIFFQMIKQAFRPSKSWGPSDVEDRAKWLAFKNQRECNNRSAGRGWFQDLFHVIFRR